MGNVGDTGAVVMGSYCTGSLRRGFAIVWSCRTKHFYFACTVHVYYCFRHSSRFKYCSSLVHVVRAVK